MIRQLVEWVGALHPLAGIALVAWALWFAAMLSVWTWAAVLTSLVLTSAQWGWSSDAALDGAVVVALVGYVVDCLLDPRADCWWCRGASKRRNARRFFHLCWVCKGSGQRKRWGSQVLARHRPDATDVT